jgi:hypothetical protein
MRRIFAYAAISLPLRRQEKDEAQRSIRTFYEAVKPVLPAFSRMVVLLPLSKA